MLPTRFARMIDILSPLDLLSDHDLLGGGVLDQVAEKAATAAGSSRVMHADGRARVA